MKTVYFGMGCFWGPQELFDPLDGVCSTRVGYASETEVVEVSFDQKTIDFSDLLIVFWKHHHPIYDSNFPVPTKYRSCIFTTNNDDLRVAKASRKIFQGLCRRNNIGELATQIHLLDQFLVASDKHQHYARTHPGGACLCRNQELFNNSEFARMSSNNHY